MLGRVLAGSISLLPLFGTPPASGRAQPGVFSFRSYGMEDGLGNLAVYAIAQDSEGFLWTGTEDGLYRYDGHRFRLWGKGLRASTIWELATGPGGRLWAATEDGAYRLDGPNLVPPEGLPRLRPGFMALGPGQRTVVALGNQVLAWHGPGSIQVLKTLPGTITHGWGSPDLRTLYATTETQIWRCQDGTWSALDLPRAFHGTSCRVCQDRSGRLFLRDRGNLWRRDAWDAPWVDLSASLPGNTTNAYPPVEDALGRIWVGTSKGLVCFDGDEAWVLGEAKGLPGGWAGTVFIDREGSLWTGSEGLQKLKGRFLWTNFGPHQGLPSPAVWDIGRSFDGRVFACTDSGVALLKGETWSTLPGTAGRTLLAGGGDGKDSLWFAGSGKDEPFNVVFRLDLKTGRLDKVSLEPCKTTDLVLAVAGAPDGGAYIGTRFEGVFRVSQGKKGWKAEALPFPDRPSGDRVNALIRDREGHLWAGAEHGLYVLEQDRWTLLGPRNGLLGANCGSLARDPDGTIWAAFQDARGINRVGREQGTWKAVASLTQPEALFNAAIASIEIEPGGVLWLGTGGGMKRWDGRTLETFGRGEGLGSQDPSANGIARDQDGGIWLGTSNGVSYFQPRAYQGPPAAPVARILEIRDARSGLDPLAAGTRVPYRDHTLTFQFSALSFLNEARIVHEVRLVGLENEWRETRINEARYAALSAGNYRFEVRSRFGEDAPGPVTGFAFRILPPWWGTLWFRLLTLLGAAGSILAFLRHRTAQLSRRNAQLEGMVAHRTEALEASKLELEKVNRALEEATLVDPLTGLHNRRYLDLSLPTDALQAQRAFRELVDAGADPLEPKEDIVLFLMDIDHFKAVNDTHGHLAGDLVLKQLAVILQDCTRATDSLVRWGGEEFLLVAKRTRRSRAPRIAQSLLEAIRNHTFQLPEGVAFHKSWSLGFSALPIHPRNPEIGDWQQALKMADQCLYAAKNTGRDRWVGALMPPDADPAPLAGLKTWDVGWALKQGLMVASSSDPDFQWPD